MAISYPLAMPTSTESHSSIVWTQRNIVGISQSPFTGQQQALHWGGDFWELDVGFSLLKRADAMVWISWLSQLQGPKGTFLYGDELTKTAQGSPAGTGAVNGASQTGYELVTDGWDVSVTNLFKAGDKIQIDNSLYMVTADVNSDISGNATLDIWPSLRGHANNALVDYTSPQGLFRLVPGSVISERVGTAQHWLIAFKAQEAI